MSALEQSESTAQSNGAPPASSGQIAVENPATGEVIGHVDDMSAERVEAIVERARRAQPAWEALGFERPRRSDARPAALVRRRTGIA